MKRLAAGRAALSLEGPFMLLDQEFGLHSEVEMIPGEPAIEGKGLEIIQAGETKFMLPGVEGLEPGAPVQVLIPAIESCSLPPGQFDESTCTVISSRDKAFQIAHSNVVHSTL